MGNNRLLWTKRLISSRTLDAKNGVCLSDHQSIMTSRYKRLWGSCPPQIRFCCANNVFVTQHLAVFMTVAMIDTRWICVVLLKNQMLPIRKDRLDSQSISVVTATYWVLNSIRASSTMSCLPPCSSQYLYANIVDSQWYSGIRGVVEMNLCRHWSIRDYSTLPNSTSEVISGLNRRRPFFNHLDMISGEIIALRRKWS